MKEEKRWTECSAQTGEIIQHVKMPEDFEPDFGSNYKLEGELEHAEWYAPGGIKTPRPFVLDETEFSIPSGQTLTLQLPIGTTANRYHEVGDGGQLEIGAHQPGEFTVELVPPFPFRPQTIRVTIE